jgi:hypothetical protein
VLAAFAMFLMPVVIAASGVDPKQLLAVFVSQVMSVASLLGP